MKKNTTNKKQNKKIDIALPTKPTSKIIKKIEFIKIGEDSNHKPKLPITHNNLF